MLRSTLKTFTWLVKFPYFIHELRIHFTSLRITMCPFSSLLPSVPSWYPKFGLSGTERKCQDMSDTPWDGATAVICHSADERLQRCWRLTLTAGRVLTALLRRLQAFCLHWTTASDHYWKEKKKKDVNEKIPFAIQIISQSEVFHCNFKNTTCNAKQQFKIEMRVCMVFGY